MARQLLDGKEINLAEWITEHMNRTKQIEIRLGEVERQFGHVGITYENTELSGALNQLILERRIDLSVEECSHGPADSYVITLVQVANPRQLESAHPARFCHDQ